MDAMWIVRVWTLFMCCALGLAQSENGNGESWSHGKYEEDAAQTFDLLFYNYNALVRPPSRYVNVTVEATLIHIRRMDLKAREIEAVIGLEMNWFDSRLSWIPNKVYQIMTNTSSVWIPDIVFLNSVFPSRQLLPGMVRVKPDGNVAWTTRQLTTTSCDTKLTEDEQTCYLNLGFMSNIKERQDDRFIQEDTTKVILRDDFKNHDWDLSSLTFDLAKDNDTGLPIQLDIKMKLQPNKSLKSGESAAYETEVNSMKCQKSCQDGGSKNSAPSLGQHMIFKVVGLSWAVFLVLGKSLHRNIVLQPSL